MRRVISVFASEDMSEDDYFNDDFDSAMLDELDAIEAAYESQISQQNSKAKNPFVAASSNSVTKQLKPPSVPSYTGKQSKEQHSLSDYDISFDIDAAELEKLDAFIADSYAGLVRPAAGPSKTIQTTLDGKTISQASTSTPPSKQSFEKAVSRTRGPLFGYAEKRTKQWDHAAFSATGWKSTKGKKEKDNTKGKAKANEDDLDEEQIEFEQFPNITTGPPPKMRLKPDLLAAKDWIYPINKPRRDYQFNIAKKCLFHNTLVALPTGLGKTFIAGVVMLNYYSWFPRGKVIFVAPTKPLVAQQISACHDICGIPGHDAFELTGDVPKHRRSAAWADKRVLYMTPQTLVNDLASGLADPLDIILIVIDEAHRGTGDYAYAQIVRFMMAKNPHFRILALSATPGNTPEAVQAIVDSLHISHIEIRNELSFDLRAYIHKKEVNVHVIKFDEFISIIRDLLVKIMDPLLTQLRSKGLIFAQSSVTVKPYACQCAMKELFQRKEMWAIGPMKYLGTLARAMGNLLECTAIDCYDTLLDMKAKLLQGATKNDKSMKEKFMKDSNYIKLMQELETRSKTGFPPHPKMDALVQIILQHFADETPAPNKESSDSKIMVFVQYRNAVDQLCQLLNSHSPMIRATRFVGQGKDKKGRKGMLQTDQLDAIRRFKDGEFNVLVSTSIGEEGLDIGEIDRIICYDAQNNPTRMLQRVGRTGRKRTGYVDVLLAEEREEKNWEKSKENYEDVQNIIINGNQLELYSDVERLLPENVNPECIQREMVIEPYVPITKDSRKSSPTRGKKVKRNNDINRNIPLGALTGFVTASELRPKGSKGKNTPKVKGIDDFRSSDVEDDSVDEEIANGLQIRPDLKKKKTKGKEKAPTKTLNNYLKKSIPDRLEDDNDDMDIEGGIKPKNGKRKKTFPSSSSSSENDEDVRKRIQKQPRKATVPSPDPSPKRPRGRPQSGTGTKIKSEPPSSSSKAFSSGSAKMPSWLLESSDGESPPPIPKKKGDEATKAIFTSPKTAAKDVHPPSFEETFESLKPKSGLVTSTPKSLQIFDITSSSQEHEIDIPSSSGAVLNTVTPHKTIDISEINSTIDLSATLASPKISFAIRSKPTKRKRALMMTPSSPEVAERGQASKPRRIVRRNHSPTPSSSVMAPPPDPPSVSPVAPRQQQKEKKEKKKPKRPKLNILDNPMLFDVEAEHSGSGISDGEDEDGSILDMIESDSDRRFLEELEPSQGSDSYDQFAAYRMGLMTQAPSQGPRFASKPKRIGRFAGGRTQVPRSQDDWDRSSSQIGEEEELDEYHMGSFVVDDDEPILFEGSSEP